MMARQVDNTSGVAAVVLLAVATLCGCQKRDAPVVQESVVSAPADAAQPLPPPPQPRMTAAQWRTAVDGAYLVNKPSTDDGGVSTFGACFDGPKEKCNVMLLGSRDPFRKLRHFQPLNTKYAGVLNMPYFGSYVALRDCEAPSLFLQARFGSKGSWIFMNAVAVMAGGEVIFEKDFSREKVSRETTSPGVEEVYDFIATEADIVAMRKVVAADSIVVRISGEKGYVTVPKKDAASGQKDLDASLKAFDKLAEAVGKDLPEACPIS